MSEAIMDIGAPSREMPRYECHKKVWALKIESIQIDGSDMCAIIGPYDPGYAVFKTAPGWADRYSGSGLDLGYYVVYEDGYASWSPSRAFEAGYTRL